MKSLLEPGVPVSLEEITGRSEYTRPWSAELSEAWHAQIKGIAEVATANTIITDAVTGKAMPYKRTFQNFAEQETKTIVAPTPPDIAEESRQELIESTLAADMPPYLKIRFLKHLGYTALPLVTKKREKLAPPETEKSKVLVAA